MLWGTLANAAVAAALAALTIAGLATIWVLILFALAAGTTQSFTWPARLAILPNVVEREHLLNAIALQGISAHGSRIVGPIFGGALLATVGVGAVFALSALLLGLSVLEIARLSPQRAVTAGRGGSGLRGTASDLQQAVRYIESDRRLALLILLVSIHCGLTMAFDSMMPTLATMVGGASGVYSAILVGIGAGAVIGTLGVSMLPGRSLHGPMFAASGIGSGLSMLLLGVAPTGPTVIVAAALTGATQMIYMTLTATLIQEELADHIRGRVMALYGAISLFHMAFLNFGFAWAADGIGVRILLIVPALLWIAVFLYAAARLGAVRAIVEGREPAAAASR